MRDWGISRGFKQIGRRLGDYRLCHPERSRGICIYRHYRSMQTLRQAQGDTVTVDNQKSAKIRENLRLKMLLMLSVICMLLLSTMAVALPSQQQVVALMGKNFKNIRDYKVDAVLSVKSPSINISAMPMTVYYKQPGRVHIDTNEGFAMVPRDMVLGNPAEDMAKSSNVTVLGQQKIAGRNAIVVKMTPKAKSENGGDHSMKMWIDAERGLVLSTVAGENSGLRFKSTWTYTQIDSKYWLPSEIRAEISNVGSNEKVLPRHKMHSPKVGDGSTVIKFRNYRVNKGIPDSVFKKPAKH